MDGQYLFLQSGKGTTEEFALASGLAEMYERFCNRIFIYTNPLLTKKFIDINKQKNGYYIDKNEKSIDFNLIQQEKELYEWFKAFFTTDEEVKTYFDIICPNGYYGVPFVEIGNSSNKKYLDIRILQHMGTSTGMAAGNTIEEALVQGLSEIFERHVAEEFFKCEQEKYFVINKSALNNELQTMIKRIEETGNTIEIYDLSYNFNYPVVLSILTNSQTGNFFIDFGSSPIFDIAVERSLTELYQGKKSYTEISYNLQQPFYSLSWYEIYGLNSAHMPRNNFIPENVICNKEIVNYNKEIYFPSNLDVSNKNLLEFYIDLLKQKNKTAYYYNCSLLEEMAAVEIFIPGMFLNFRPEYFKNKATNEQKSKNLEYCINTINAVNNFLDKNITWEQDNTEKILYKLNEFIENGDRNAQNCLRGSNWYVPYFDLLNWFNPIIDILLHDEVIDRFYRINISNQSYSNLIKKYFTLYNYALFNYNDEKISHLAKTFNLQLNNQEIKLLKEKWFIFYKILIEPLQKEWFSNRHYKILYNFA